MEFSLSRAFWGRAGGRHADPILLPADAACSVELPLAQLFSNARARRGLTSEQAARDARVMVSYLRMIECGDYSAIPDMLYLLPFIQRYAAFLGLDVREVTARFVRDFEAAEDAIAAPPAFPRPTIVMKSLPWPRIAQGAAIGSVAILLAGLAFAIARGTSQRTPEVSPNALTSLPPPMHVRTVPTPAPVPPPTIAEAPVPAPTVAQAAPKPAARPRRHSIRAGTPAHHRRRHRMPG